MELLIFSQDGHLIPQDRLQGLQSKHEVRRLRSVSSLFPASRLLPELVRDASPDSALTP